MAAEVLRDSPAAGGAHNPLQPEPHGSGARDERARAGAAPSPGSPGGGDLADDAALLDDLITERAAIIEYDGGFSRREAQNMAARGHGFAGWDDYQKKKGKL